MALFAIENSVKIGGKIDKEWRWKAGIFGRGKRNYELQIMNYKLGAAAAGKGLASVIPSPGGRVDFCGAKRRVRNGEMLRLGKKSVQMLGRQISARIPHPSA